MKMRSFYWAVALLAVTGVLYWRVSHSSVSIHAASTVVAPAQSFLIILGVGDSAATNWDGSVTVTGSTVEIIRG